MSAYFILTQDCDDPNRYVEEYVPKVMPFIQKHGGEILVATFDAAGVEGSPAKGAVVVRFADEEAAKGFVNDPEYAPAKALRHSITRNFNGVVVPGFVMPGG